MSVLQGSDLHVIIKSESLVLVGDKKDRFGLHCITVVAKIDIDAADILLSSQPVAVPFWMSCGACQLLFLFGILLSPASCILLV